MSDRDVLGALGAALLHTLWIGAAIAAWSWLALRVLSTARASSRYAVAMGALAWMAAAVPLAALASRPGDHPALRWLAVGWLAGVATISIRLVNSLRLVHHLRRRARPVSGTKAEALREVARSMRVDQTVALAESDEIDGPCSLGLTRPLVLMPEGALDELSAEGFRAVAAHEMGHIWRRDYAWNVLQRTLEAVVFFHPAARWLSGVVRREREQCSDDLAVRVVAPLELARALTHLERRRADDRPDRANRTTPLLDRVRELFHRADGGGAPGGRPRVVLSSLLWTGTGVLAIAAVWTSRQAPVLWTGIAAPWLVATGLGLLVGLRHAFEPAHLMAVATLVSRERSPLAAARLGVSWGVGHTVSLMAVGSLLAAARLAVPGPVETAFEVAVALMVVAMGVRALHEAWRVAAEGPVVSHVHGARVHAHASSGHHLHIGPWTLARRPMAVGLVHGLAGSGALTAMAVASLPTLPAQIGFMFVFGLGSALGMAVVAGLAGWPIVRVARTRPAMASLSAATGAAAVLFGLWWGAPLVWHLLA